MVEKRFAFGGRISVVESAISDLQHRREYFKCNILGVKNYMSLYVNFFVERGRDENNKDNDWMLFTGISRANMVPQAKRFKE